MPSGAWQGALFPLLSANLDFSADAGLGNRTVPAGCDASTLSAGRIAPSVVLRRGGETIGGVELTTPLLPNISSPGAVRVSPVDSADLAALAQSQIGALTAAGVARVYEGSGLDPFAAGSRGANVRAVTSAISAVIASKDGNLFGRSEVYLNGLRAEVRTQETNLGNLSSDANLFVARRSDPTVRVSVKNGGGVRDSIGAIEAATGGRIATTANPLAGKTAGQVSQLDIENSLRFNNALTALTVTAEQLKVVLEHAVAAVAPGQTPGQFGQFGGIRYSYDPTRTAQVLTGNPGTGAATIATPGRRVLNAALIDEAGNVTEVLVRDGVVIGDPNRAIRLV